jgi:hypothetical protein
MALVCLFVDVSTLAADINGITGETKNGRHEIDTAVAVLVVVTVEERGDQLTGMISRGKRLAGE